MSITDQRGLEALAARLTLRTPELLGYALAYGAAARLPDKGGKIIFQLARRHAGKRKFQKLCQAI